jgi:plasmid maintenance system antidote protein VapI
MKTENEQIPLYSPGEMLDEEFLKPMGITAYRLAKDIHVPATRARRVYRASGSRIFQRGHSH